MIDAASSFVRMLLTLPVINSTCAGRIYGAAVPASEVERWQTPDQVRTTILITDLGSEHDATQPGIDANVEIRVYAKDHDEALYATNLLFLEMPAFYNLLELRFRHVRQTTAPAPDWDEGDIAFVMCGYAARIYEIY